MAPLTRLRDDGIDYPQLLQRIIALPAEIQMIILRPLLTVDRPNKYYLQKALRFYYKPWLLVSKRLAPQVKEVFWKDNIFPLAIRVDGESARSILWSPHTSDTVPPIHYMVPQKAAAAFIHNVV